MADLMDECGDGFEIREAKDMGCLPRILYNYHAALLDALPLLWRPRYDGGERWLSQLLSKQHLIKSKKRVASKR
jgi:hypothetical protein